MHRIIKSKSPAIADLVLDDYVIALKQAVVGRPCVASEHPLIDGAPYHCRIKYNWPVCPGLGKRGCPARLAALRQNTEGK